MTRAGASLAIVSLLLSAVSCGRGSRSSAGAPDVARERAAPSSAPEAGPAAPSPSRDGGLEDAGGEAEGPRRGLYGRVVVAGESPAATLLVFRPGQQEPVATTKVDGSHRFHLPDLAPGTYRVVLPGDGVHATADLYASVPPPDAEAAAPVMVHRSKGCPVRATFRQGESDAGAAPLVGARVEMLMPDLEHVADRVTLSAVTDAEGSVTVVGTCVRGFIEGTVEHGGTKRPFRHGYLGSGRDRFDILFEPGGDGGPPPGAGAR